MYTTSTFVKKRKETCMSKAAQAAAGLSYQDIPACLHRAGFIQGIGGYFHSVSAMLFLSTFTAEYLNRLPSIRDCRIVVQYKSLSFSLH